MPGARMQSSVNVATVTNTITLFDQFDTIEFDTGGFHAAGVNDRLVVPAGMGGLYLIGAEMVWELHADAMQRLAMIYVNGAQVTASSMFTSAGDARAPIHFLCAPFTLAAGDIIQLYGRQRSGVNLNMGGGNLGTKMWLLRQGPVP